MNTNETATPRTDAEMTEGMFGKVLVGIAFARTLEIELQEAQREKQRLFDLVRYQRAELHEAGLINDKEYADLAACPDSKESVARLEAYDSLTRENAELKKDKERLDWLANGGRAARFTDGWCCWSSKTNRDSQSHDLRQAIDAAMHNEKNGE